MKYHLHLLLLSPPPPPQDDDIPPPPPPLPVQEDEILLDEPLADDKYTAESESSRHQPSETHKQEQRHKNNDKIESMVIIQEKDKESFSITQVKAYYYVHSILKSEHAVIMVDVPRDI